MILKPPIFSKPSELLEIALRDLKLVERDSRYSVDMLVWHDPNWDGGCDVCLAGAVLAKSVEFPIKQTFPRALAGRNAWLLALDDFRKGNVRSGLERLGRLATYTGPPVFPTVRYSSYRPAPFHENMESLVSLLKEHGL